MLMNIHLHSPLYLLVAVLFKQKWELKKVSPQVPDHPEFALVNEATGLALRHAVAAGKPVRLIEYNPDDKEIWWSITHSDGYSTLGYINKMIEHLYLEAIRLIGATEGDWQIICARNNKQNKQDDQDDQLWKFSLLNN